MGVTYAGKAALVAYRYKTAVVDHPAVVAALGAPILVRGLSGAESVAIAETIENDLEVQAGEEGAQPTFKIKSFARMAKAGAWAVRYGWIDADGNQVLGDDDIDLVLRLTDEVLQPIADAINALSGQTKGSRSALKKSSGATLTPDSGTP